jgi:hypothetical protein
MAAHNTKVKYFVEAGAPIPMHMLLMDEMPQLGFSIRFVESAIARAEGYVCVQFYKPISRPLPLDLKEKDHDRKN